MKPSTDISLMSATLPLFMQSVACYWVQMWGCNEQWLWQRLPGDEQRAALCPDVEDEGERDGWRGWNGWTGWDESFVEGLGGVKRRFRAFSQVQSVTCVELCGCIFCSNTCRPGARNMSKPAVYVYHYLPHVRAREGCVKIISQQNMCT